MERDSRKLIRLLEQAGWSLIEIRGDHHHFKHATIVGKVTVQHPRKDVPIGTLRSIYRQAGWIK